MDDKTFEEKLQRGRNALEYLNNRYRRRLIGRGNKWVDKSSPIELNEFYLFQIHEVTFEEKAPRKEAIENILGTLRGMEGISFIYLILGDATGVKFYFGAALDKSYKKDLPFSVHDLEQDILTPSMKGNFRGSKISEVNRDDKKNILDKMQRAKSFGILEGVPSVDEKNENFQGTDRLIDVMQGDEFGFAVIAKPYTDAEINDLERRLCELSDLLAPVARHTIQRSSSSGTNRNDGKNFSYAKQAGDSSQHSKSDAYSTNDTTNQDERRDNSNQIQSTAGNSTNEQTTVSKSYGKRTGDKDSESADNGRNESSSVQSQTGRNFSVSATQGKSTSNSFSESKSFHDDVTETYSKNFSKNLTRAHNVTESENFSISEQSESESKSAVDWLNYIDKVLMPRLDRGRGKGIFLCCSYLFAEKRTSLYRLANTAISLYSGATGNKSALFFCDLTDRNDDTACSDALKNLQIPAVLRVKTDEIFATGLSRHEILKYSYCGSWLSANELGLLAGLPQKEVIGLRLREEVEFGLNVKRVPKEFAVELGHLVQSGEVKENIPVCLDKRDFDKHAFISGVTGSGKTTTCQNILVGWNGAFLVIEPAKTEYRSLKKNFSDLLFFTPGLPDVAPFFLNPFELFIGEKISSRADMLKATFEASFAMEAAIPQILEAAIYRAYEKKGWHIATNSWRGGNPFADGVYAFPTLSDFVKATQEITDEQGFDERLKNDYRGSINARLEGLLVGAKGQMFNTSRSINFLNLVNRRVVIELEEIRSSSEKSLLMGFILTNLLQAVKYCHAQDKNFRHITLVEEAHRLLSRYVPGDNLNKKQGVEVFTDMLAEVRKYGESLIIVDQIPDKMTPEVLKNTNTKIIHKLFAQDDKDAVGNTMALNDEQKSFLSNLTPGRAVMFSQGWTKAIQLQVEEKISAEREEIDVSEIRQSALKYYLEPENCRRGILRGLERLSEVDEKILTNWLELMQHGDLFLKIYLKYLRDGSAGETSKADDVNRFNDFAKAIRDAVKKFGVESVTAYLCANAYSDADDVRDKTLCDVIQKIIDDENVSMSVITNNITRLQ
ncbi:MAG: DUF87 domain-containing protein [Selenomonadaceae bacterium]|nr:DUF87 domain-containing protein [Selenomonadaceae bacterium]